MNTEQFVESGKAVIEFLGDHCENIGDLNVMPILEPGYLKKLIPSEAPQKGEDFKDILEDVKTKIVPGILHWHHPNFYAYFPVGNSYPSILGELLSAGFGGLAFSWVSSPAYTELETIVLDWFAKAMHLPLSFYTGDGGGVMQGSASESVLVCLMTARDRTIRELKSGAGDIQDSVFLPQLVAYSSSLAHSSVEKAAKMALVKLRILEPDAHGRLCHDTLRAAIRKDLDTGLTPFFVVATVGTTAACSFDNLEEIGQVCKETPTVWLHVDGAYGGPTFILPEMRHFMKGLELADSFNANPHKHMLVSFDASCMWVKDVMLLKTALTVNPLYLQHDHESVIDYRHYGIPLSRRFRALKLWFVFRSYGIEGIQRYMRNHNELAKRFEKYVREDNRFVVMNDVYLGLVCFRLVHTERVNRELLSRINLSGQYHLIPSIVGGKYVIRFCITYEHAKEENIDAAWAMIQKAATYVLATQTNNSEDELSDSSVPKPPKQAVTRLSFTRTVTREMFDRHHSLDGLTGMPILVVESDDNDNNSPTHSGGDSSDAAS